VRGTFYKLLGLFVWKAVLVYLRQKAPGRGRLALGGAVAALALAAGAGAKQLGSDDSS
jgi:hypothetical protein